MSKSKTVFIGNNKSFWDRNRRSEGYLLKRKVRSIGVSIIRALLMFGLCFMIIQPMLIRITSGFMPESDLYDTTIVMMPRSITTDNYRLVFGLTRFPDSMINTLWISVLMSVFQIVSCTLVAYGFARYEFPLKKFWFACVIMVIVIPPSTIQTALYVTFSSFDFFGIFTKTTGQPISLLSSILPYSLMCITCMGLKNGLYIYMLRQYFIGVPKSLEEAAYIDGCGTMHTFTKIMLPDALPTIASCFLFAFVWQWTDVFYSRIFLKSYSIYAVEMTSIVSRLSRELAEPGQNAIQVSPNRSQQLISIAVLVCCIPLIILYCFTQKTFVKSLAMTGSKE